MAPITTIVHFTVPAENMERFLPAWYANEELTVKQPGMIDGIFYRCTDPDSPFQFVNVARWESAEALQTALQAVGEEQAQRGTDRSRVLDDMGVRISQSNYVEELRYSGPS